MIDNDGHESHAGSEQLGGKKNQCAHSEHAGVRSLSKLQYSLSELLIATAIVAVFLSFWRLLGGAGVPAALALLAVILTLNKLLCNLGVIRRSWVGTSFPKLFLITSILIHITLIWACFPRAAKVASDLCRQRYKEEIAAGKEPNLELKEWARYHEQRDALAMILVAFGYPGSLVPILLGESLSFHFGLRGSVFVILGLYLVLIPVLIAAARIYRYM